MDRNDQSPDTHFRINPAVFVSRSLYHLFEEIEQHAHSFTNQTNRKNSTFYN